MSMQEYLRFALFDYLLTCVAGTALTYVMLDSFYISPAFQYSPLPGMAAVLLLTALFLSARTRATARVGGVLIALACLAAVAVALVLSPEAFLADTEENYFYAALVCELVPLLSFGLTRSHMGCAIYFGIGAFICAWMEFFYEFYELVWTLLFVFCALALVVYKNYQRCARGATSVRTLSFAAGSAVSVGSVVLAVGVACLVWVCVIEPLGPEALEIKLIEEYRALETLEVQGTSDDEMVPVLDITSDDLSEHLRTTDDLLEERTGKQMPAPEEDPEAAAPQSSGEFTAIDIDTVTQSLESFTDEEDFPYWVFWLFLLIPVLVVVAYFVGRRVYRNVRLANMQKLPLNEQAEAIYLFLVRKLGHLGFSVPEGVTLLEFAGNNEESLREFRETSGVGFSQVTSVYVGSVYGREPVTQAGADQLASFYQGFWKAARKKLGNVKYLFKSFVL